MNNIEIEICKVFRKMTSKFLEIPESEIVVKIGKVKNFFSPWIKKVKNPYGFIEFEDGSQDCHIGLFQGRKAIVDKKLDKPSLVNLPKIIQMNYGKYNADTVICSAVSCGGKTTANLWIKLDNFIKVYGDKELSSMYEFRKLVEDNISRSTSNNIVNLNPNPQKEEQSTNRAFAAN
ncbi:MAG: hypothetical protein ACI9GH_000221 [Candidatus Paceibacteria bacterium]|jgi:hypothetical protein